MRKKNRPFDELLLSISTRWLIPIVEESTSTEYPKGDEYSSWKHIEESIEIILLQDQRWFKKCLNQIFI